MAKRVIDRQTGESFLVERERTPDLIAAWVSIIYTLAVIVYLGWFLFEMWVGKYPSLFVSANTNPPAQLGYPIFKLVIYTAIGGGIGAAVNNIRSFVYWHAELNAFGRRFVWKYISMPPLGAVLAVMVYALIRGGTALISGSSPSGAGADSVTSLSAWVAGALAGYGSGKVLIWLDDKVNSLFKVDSKAAEVAVPDLSGKTRDEAAQILKDVKLVLGDVSEVQTSDAGKIGKVISQTPATGSKAAPDNKVSISIGKEISSEVGKVTVPDVSGKTRDEAEQTLKDGQLALGAVSPGPTSNGQLVDKVISQTPLAGAEVAPDSTVALTIGTASDGETGSEGAKVVVPDVKGQTQEEAAQTLKDGQLTLGDVSTEPTTDEQMIDKVISQTPVAETETTPGSHVAITLGKASDV